MLDRQRLKLRFGRYRTPKFRYGRKVLDAIRGEVEIVGLHDAPIPWPIGKRGRSRAIILYGDWQRPFDVSLPLRFGTGGALGPRR